MPYLTGVALYVALGLALVSITVGYYGGRIYWKLRNSSNQAMAKLKLQPEKTRKEFKALFLANFVMLPALAAFTYGSIIDIDLFRNIGRVGFIIFAIVILSIQYSWWRRL